VSEQGDHVIQEISTELGPERAIQVHLLRFLVVAPQHCKQGEAAETDLGLNGCPLITQHLKQQAQVVGEWRLIW
jgi:hypothetical protein